MRRPKITGVASTESDLTPDQQPNATPQQNLETVLMTCANRGVDDYTRRAAVLTGYAESDFDTSARQVGRENGESFGVYQQKPRWWPTAGGTTADQTGAFLDAFAAIKRTGDLVHDCWQVQRWAPSDAYDPNSVETKNYTNRLGKLDSIINNQRLP